MITLSGESDLLLTCKYTLNGIAILRCETSSEFVRLPDFILDSPVVQIEDYAFSTRTSKSPAEEHFTVHVTTGDSTPITHNATAIRQVQLPNQLHSLGSYCFYNCTNLQQLEIGSILTSIGADAFMNCFSLHKIIVHTSAQQCHCLRSLLQIYSGELEIQFLSSEEPECRLFFPAYDEEYEEMAAPHIFYYNIAGNGYLCRQSFSGNIFNFSQYDSAFDLLLKTHSFELATKVALNRLRFPVQLSEPARLAYLQHLTLHNDTALNYILEQKNITLLNFFLNLQIITQDSLSDGCDKARNSGQTEALGVLLEYKNKHFGTPKAKSFDL